IQRLKKLLKWHGETTRNTVRVRSHDAQVRNFTIRNMLFRSNGSTRAEPSYKPKNGKKIPSRNPESSSSTALRAAIKLVPEKYPRHFALRKWLREQSSTPKASRSIC